MTAIALKIAPTALQQVPAVQRVGRHGAQRDRLPEVRARRRRGRYAQRGLLVPVMRDVDRKGIIELASRARRRRPRRRAPASCRSTTCRAAASRSPISAGSAARRSRRSSTGRRWRFSASRAARSNRCGRRPAFEPRLMLPLSLSYDHRVIDGADARPLPALGRGSVRAAVRADRCWRHRETGVPIAECANCSYSASL